MGADHKDNMIEALTTLKDRLQKGDPNVLYSVVNDLSKVRIYQGTTVRSIVSCAKSSVHVK